MIACPGCANPAADVADSAARIHTPPGTHRNRLRIGIAHRAFLAAFFLIGLAVFFCPARCAAQVPASRPRHVLTDQEVIRGIDAAVRAREDAIAGYTVNERYLIYVGGDSNPAAAKAVTVVYTRGSGETITPTGEDGNALLNSMIVDQVLNGEASLAAPQARESVLINSSNYEMTPESGRVQVSGHECVVVDLQSRQTGTGLFNGKVWVDDTTFGFVHLEGAPSEAPNVMVGNITFAWDYATVDGLNMQVHAESHASSPLLGNVTLVEDSTNYQIRH